MFRVSRVSEPYKVSDPYFLHTFCFLRLNRALLYLWYRYFWSFVHLRCCLIAFNTLTNMLSRERETKWNKIKALNLTWICASVIMVVPFYRKGCTPRGENNSSSDRMDFTVDGVAFESWMTFDSYRNASGNIRLHVGKSRDQGEKNEDGVTWIGNCVIHMYIGGQIYTPLTSFH